ncbi:MAG: flagellar biosynthesis anti-sigma factor FlgM [Bacillota bacterium]
MAILWNIFNVLPLVQTRSKNTKRYPKICYAELCLYREAIKALPSVREEKVANFKKVLATGEYRIDPYQIAQKMLEWSLLDLVFSSC